MSRRTSPLMEENGAIIRDYLTSIRKQTPPARLRRWSDWLLSWTVFLELRGHGLLEATVEDAVAWREHLREAGPVSAVVWPMAGTAWGLHAWLVEGGKAAANPFGSRRPQPHKAPRPPAPVPVASKAAGPEAPANPAEQASEPRGDGGLLGAYCRTLDANPRFARLNRDLLMSWLEWTRTRATSLADVTPEDVRAFADRAEAVLVAAATFHGWLLEHGYAADTPFGAGAPVAMMPARRLGPLIPEQRWASGGRGWSW